MELREKTIRELKTAWLELGTENDEILLCLHGFPDSPEIWSKLAQIASKEFHVVCPFARGVGSSVASRQTSRFGTRSFALDVLSILDTVDPSQEKKITLVGHDLGVAHAWALAPLLGNRLRALVQINGLSLAQMMRRMKSPSQILKSWYIGFNQIPALADWAYGHFMPTLTELAHLLGKSRAHESCAQYESRESFRQYRAMVREAIAQNFSHQVPATQAPALVLWGNPDPFLNIPTEDEFAIHTSCVTIRILAGGHWFFYDEPQIVLDLIRKFLNEHSRPGIPHVVASVVPQDFSSGKHPAD